MSDRAFAAIADLVRRLRGEYRIPIKDGLGPAGGDEPGNADEFVRHFGTSPIKQEAAAVIETLIARAEAAEAQVEALTAKVDALCAKGECGCSWDREGDVCEHHSPKLVAALAQVERLREAAAPFVAYYRPWMDELAAERCWAFPAQNMGRVRKLSEALAGKGSADG